MSWANPAGLWLLGLMVPILALHVLRPKREAVEVSSVFLWRSMAQPVSSARPWQRLRPSLLLLLQLLVVAGLALAVARPVRLSDAPLAEHTVVIVDASGSMAARDGDPDRLARARTVAKEVWDDLPSGAVVSVVVADHNPRVVLNAGSTRSEFESAIDAIDLTPGGSADFADAFNRAKSLEALGLDMAFVLVSDGGLSDAEARLIPPGTTYRPVGEEAANRAITRLTVERRGVGLSAIVAVANTGGPAADQTLRVDVDGETIHTETVSLGRGEELEVTVDLPAGERVEAFLEGEDLLDVDNHRYAVAPARRAVQVAVVNHPDERAGSGLVLEALFEAMGEEVVAEAVAPGDDISGYDLVVYNRVDVPATAETPYWAIRPPGGAPGIEVRDGAIEAPTPVLLRDDDDLLRDISGLHNILVNQSQQLEVISAETLLAGEGAPLLLRGPAGSTPYIYMSFGLTESTLFRENAFPVLGDRIIDELAGAARPAGGLEVGERLPLDPTLGHQVSGPRGVEHDVGPGAPTPTADRLGFWTVETEGRGSYTVAVNPAADQSSLEPAAALPAPERESRPGEALPRGERSLLHWLVWPLLALVAVEWLLVRRRSGVPRRQFRIATALRVLVVVALVVALLGLSFTRRESDVATVFLVDGSQSLGRAGQEEALDWVRDAIADMPAGSRAAVALFGGDTVLELVMQEDPVLGPATAQIDRDQTDLAQALGMATAVLPGDARRRVVLVTDGRQTQGDVQDEAARLREAGVPVDIHVVGRAVGRDAAVTTVASPNRVRPEEEVPITATVHATAAGPAEVTLTAAGEVLARQVVDLEPGDNEIEFTMPAGDSGLVRFQVRVASAGDAVPENDVGFGAVLIEGSGRVLLLEGRDGVAETLATALTEAGMTVEVQSPGSLPALDSLAAYQSVVLVDVPAFDLTSDQVATLAASTRDQGRGLVTVGGVQSYGLGGYLDSELEQLLPVVSDILDPERRQTVAQVLAIDTSGSMGACHCNEGDVGGLPGGGNQVGGGVVKTDIARAGAARAIEALSSVDEVGILAVDREERWLIDLQRLPAEDVVRSGLRDLSFRSTPGTDLSRSLSESADALRQSTSTLKHIILFTDGFVSGADSELRNLADEAAELFDDDGITVSVIGTGEGSSALLEEIAVAGGGRYYPGRDLHELPQLMQEETVMASRDFVQEGEFFPIVTSTASTVRGLEESPPLLGFIATTAKPQVDTQLRLGPEEDPLLVSWSHGLGRVTSWTSDGGDRWGSRWATWPDYVDFWAGVVGDTFPPVDEGVSATIDNGVLTVTVEGEGAFPEGAEARARITDPRLGSRDLRLERVAGNTFVGELAVTAPGTYAVAAQVHDGGADVAQGTALANLSYSAEHLPGESDPALLLTVSDLTDGRGEIQPEQAFDAADLPAGRSKVPLAVWALLAAALLWPLGVALSRLALQGAVVRQVRSARGTARWAATTLWHKLPALPGRARAEPPARRARRAEEEPTRVATTEELEEAARRQTEEAPAETLGSLLDAKRRRREE